MDISDFDFKNIEIPAIARGAVLPHGVEAELMNQEKEKILRKQQRRHEWRMEIFSLIGGGIMGFITSLIFWLIERG